ncbi:hypothetical protein AU197_01485 [Mycobacterium sp. IS-1590]|uniref:YncE family protein n=1 Tax=Mycobacterium sp. IS-1590 TaxID=1772286 RepID=UPI00074ADEF5|nr:YncE family protein [Mycobacterium sp. IS-1590]KUI41237.1 hypothetical protein AU197_01485 [Mycobacterium sp. IS-1590]
MLGVLATIPVGLTPGWIAISADGARAYVLNNTSDTISVIDTATNSVTATIAVADDPAYLMHAVVHPDGDRLYVSRLGVVSVVDVTAKVVVAEIPVGNSWMRLAINPDGTTVYAAGGDTDTDTVTVIDTSTNTVTGTIDTDQDPYWPAVTPDGARLYVSHIHAGTILVIDTTTNAVVDSITVGGQPGAIVLSPDGGRIFASILTSWANGLKAEAVKVIDTASGNVAATVTIPGDFWPPAGMAVDSDGSRVFVASAAADWSGVVSVIDTTTNTLIDTIDVHGPSGVVVTPDGSRIYAVNQVQDTVSVIGRTFRWDASRLPDLVGQLMGGAGSDGGGWLVIGNRFYKIPPRPPAVLAIARAAPYLGEPVENRKLGQQLRKGLS